MRLIHRYIVVALLVFGVGVPCLILLTNTILRDEEYVNRRVTYAIRNVPIPKTNNKCRFHSCFNIFQCKLTVDERIKVYVHPFAEYTTAKGNKHFGELTYEFEAILHAFQESKYRTNNISEACLIIPSIDLLSEKGIDLHLASTALASLPRWQNGKNHLLFNLFPQLPLRQSEVLNVQIGEAMVVSANLMTSNYRQGFDISIPVYNSLTVSSPGERKVSISARRRWNLIVSQLSMDKSHRDTLRKVEDSEEGILMLRKCLGTPSDVLVNRNLCKDGLPFSYPSVLKEGTFCLLLPGLYYGTTLLLDAMMMGCIPVVAMDDYILPFQDVVDWNRASVKLKEYQLKDIVNILNKLDEDQVKERRYQALYLWKKYFSTIPKIVETVLDIYNERVFVNHKRSYEEWNGRYGRIQGEQYKPGSLPPLIYPLKPASREGFTAIILTYNRVEMLKVLMRALDTVPSLTKLIVVWNNAYSNPDKHEWPILSKPWELIKMKTNRLTNRFYPFKEIETEAVMAIDDDILMLTSDEIEFAYQAWLEFPDRLVGFPARVHITDPGELINGKRMKYKYESEWQDEVSMVLTGAAFYHKVYNHLFTYALPFHTKDYIDEKMNCEDIGMNFLIANLTGKPPIKVTPRKRFKCAQCRGNDSLWSETSHFIKRSECLSVFVDHFGRMPLEPVEYRVDPVLYEENVPLEMKAYPDLGMV